MEYQAAQDSAQHHDTLVWTTTSIMWGASLVLIGFTLEQLDKPALRWILTFASSLGIVMTVTLWIFALQLNSIMRQKYARCREIEIFLKLKQHTTLKHSSGTQRLLYGLVMLLFLGSWVVVVCTIW